MSPFLFHISESTWSILMSLHVQCSSSLHAKKSVPTLSTFSVLSNDSSGSVAPQSTCGAKNVQRSISIYLLMRVWDSEREVHHIYSVKIVSICHMVRHPFLPSELMNNGNFCTYLETSIGDFTSCQFIKTYILYIIFKFIFIYHNHNTLLCS